MTTTDDARLVEIEAREQAATPGPWEVDARARTRITSANDRGVATAGGYTTNTDGGAHHDQNEANAAFIAHSREDVRYLLDRLKAAESRIRAAKSVIGRWESYDSIHADASRALSQIEEALHSDEVQEERNGVR